MLKEERQLRDLIKDLDTDHFCCLSCGSDSERHRKGCRWGMVSPSITTLVRAVREDCAKVVFNVGPACGGCATQIAAAIRREK